MTACNTQGGRTPAEKADNLKSCQSDCRIKWPTSVSSSQLASGVSVPITKASAYSAPDRANTNKVYCKGSACAFSGRCPTTYNWRTGGCLPGEQVVPIVAPNSNYM